MLVSLGLSAEATHPATTCNVPNTCPKHQQNRIRVCVCMERDQIQETKRVTAKESV